MAIIIDTPTIHKSLAQLVLSITPNAYVYDNPNQQGTHLPAWFIVHREPVDIKEDLHGRWWLNYHIDLFYMLDFNGPHLFDDYSAIADRLGEMGEYLPIYGHDNVVIHAFERSWGMYMDALKCSMTFKIRVTRDSTPPVYMDVIEDLSVFLKNQKVEFCTLSFTNDEHPDFSVELPDDIVASVDSFVKLPSVSGEHEEGDELWVPNAWDIGAFGQAVKMANDITANLLWEVLQQFVVSFANTTYPQFDVDLPEQIVVRAGEAIMLPSVSGQFVEGGYVYTPSGWDIGDFGSEFTPTGNTIANLVFNSEKQYEEIRLYLPSGNKQAQKQVTSGFTGNVNATYCYQLYVDEQLTTPWTGYDYSNDYELGHYSGGVWVPWTKTSVSSLPDTYTSDSTQWEMAYILMDNGFLWLASNVSGSGYMSYPSTFIRVRIYPKGQQWIPAFPYNVSSGKYDNLSTNRKGTFVRKGTPATVFGTFPAIAESFGYKSGMIKSASIQAEFQISQATLYLNVAGNPALSNIVVRFENDICTGYVRSDKADLPTSPSYDGATYTLKDDNGNDIDYDDSFTYKFVLLLNSTGDTVGGTYSTGAMIKSSTGKLQVRMKYQSSKFNRVWYYRIPKL